MKLEREGRACVNVEEVLLLAEKKALTDKKIAEIADCSVVAVRRWREVGRGSYDHVNRLSMYLSGVEVATPKGKSLQITNIEDLAHRAAELGFEASFRYVGKEHFSFDIEKDKTGNESRGHTKFLFNGEELGQGRLVWSVVKHLVDTKGFNYAKLVEAFPKNTQGSLGVISHVEDVRDERRFFMKNDEIITLPDGGEIVVCREWGMGVNPNTPRFVEAAIGLGCDVKKIM